jgi:CO/xanthine dehydrogenase Mo-binding subunit
LGSDRIFYSGQPIALVVAESFEAAGDAASLVRAEYDVEPHCTELERKRAGAYDPPEKRSGIPPPPEPHGDAEAAFTRAPYKVSRDYAFAKLNTATPSDVRAPGAAVGVTALECAMDELSYEIGIDPLKLREVNFTANDESSGKALTSKALFACYKQGAEAIGWHRRKLQPRSMREGHELVGLGMATGVWEASLQKAQAFTAEGRFEISTAASDIGTGTWTILAQVAADALGFRSMLSFL